MTVITRARLSDIEGLCAVEQDVFVSDFFNRRDFSYFLKTSTVTRMWVARHRGKIVGYIIVKFRQKSPWCHVHALTVSRSFQGRGIGRKLMKRAIAEAKKRKRSVLTLEVRAKQRKTRVFYKRLGFHEVEHMKSRYKNNDDAVQMMYFIT